MCNEIEQGKRLAKALTKQLTGGDRIKALHEVARVLKAHGEFLLLIVNTDWWTWLVSPPLAHHFRPDTARWRAQLDQAGFAVEEEGRQPVTLYWLARKK